jgi:UDP-glucose 4-epimerase
LLSCDSANGEIVNVGNDQEISITELAKLVVKRADSTSTLHYSAHARADGERFENTTHCRPILEKLKTLTHFEPHWTLSQTLDELIAHERRNLNTNSIKFSKHKQQSMVATL